MLVRTAWRAFMLLAVLGGPAATASASAESPEVPIVVRGTPLQRAPEVFGTVGLPVRPERYLELWRHASSGDLEAPALQRFIAPARALGRAAQLDYVQLAARQIRWRSDATGWGQHDYWATAAETLGVGYGDDDDLAILKMQALEALGWPARDLYLTLGHDDVAGPITVLLVRTDSDFRILDEREDHSLPVSQRTGFVPQLSFSDSGAWLHGHRYLAAAAGARTAAK